MHVVCGRFASSISFHNPPLHCLSPTIARGRRNHESRRKLDANIIVGRLPRETSIRSLRIAARNRPRTHTLTTAALVGRATEVPPTQSSTDTNTHCAGAQNSLLLVSSSSTSQLKILCKVLSPAAAAAAATAFTTPTATVTATNQRSIKSCTGNHPPLY